MTNNISFTQTIKNMIVPHYVYNVLNEYIVTRSYQYKLEMITKYVVNAVILTVKFVHCVLWGYELICLHKSGTFFVLCLCYLHIVFLLSLIQCDILYYCVQ